ncbi:MAG: alpha/beta hydrolase [Actinomycetota bacterium]
MGLRWRDLTAEERERAYSPSSCLPDGDYRPFVEQYVTRSARAWADVQAAATTTVLTYGPLASNTIDVAIPSASTATATGGPMPLLVFVHGGYWQELSKIESRFAAADSVERGWAFAAVDYTLAPRIPVGGIVDECRTALAALQDAALGFDPGRIVVAGSSAGAQLAAMMALRPGAAAAVLVSGVFELAPLIGTEIDDALGLDPDEAARLSPLHLDLDGFPPTLVAHGDNETDEFKAQSRSFAAALGPVEPIEIPDRNHFDVILDLARSGTTLGDAVGRLIGDL